MSALEAESWSLAANHLHSAPGGEAAWGRGIAHIASWCEANGVRFAALTDHNTIGGWFLPEFSQARGVVMIPGEEWTSNGGHANLIDYAASGPEGAIRPGAEGYCAAEPGHEALLVPDSPPPDHQAMVREVHARGGLVLINHPGLPLYPWPENTFGADACEVGPNFLDFRGRKSFAWWMRRLEEGSRICAVAGSDYHYLRPKEADDKDPVFTPAIDTPINLLLAPTEDVAGFRKAIESRHVQVLKGRKAPRLLVGIDGNGDGVYGEGTLGDIVSGRHGDTVSISIRVLGGRKETLRLIESRMGGNEADRQLTEVPITADDFTHVLSRSITGTESSFLIISVGSLKTIGNPIWY